MQSRGLLVPRGPRGLSSQMGQMALVGSFPRPAFGSSPNLQALAREVERDGEEEVPLLFYEITIASGDRPKLLSQVRRRSGVILGLCASSTMRSIVVE